MKRLLLLAVLLAGVSGPGVLLFGAEGASDPSVPPVVEIADDGKALLPIVVLEHAPEPVKALAREMADYLHRITGATFDVVAGPANAGIVLGTGGDFPDLLPSVPQGRSPLLTSDDYILKTESGRVLLVGRDAHGTRNAMWDFLYRIGFRQFFPGKNWAIWPHESHLSIALDAFESPSYFTRRIFLGGHTWPESKAAFSQWEVRNRMDSGFTLNTSHAYGAIIMRNRAYFDAHPEDIAPHKKPGSAKLDASNEGVRDIAARDAIAQLEKNPDMDSVSMDPSDGGDWPKESPLGSPSNQAVTLANHVARAIQEQFPGRKVGMYAYNEHASPPEIAVDPNVIVSVATAFLKDGHTVDGLLKGWQAKGVETGIREYLSVWPWEMDMPGRSRATQLDYIFESIPHFYELGARYWISEASDSWGAQGLGYYLASRLLWDVSAATRAKALLEDFYKRSFGAAAPEMKRYFQCVLAEGRPLLSEDLLGQMYRDLEAALNKASSPEISARIFDLVIYTRSLELMFAYQNSDGAKRQQAYEKLAHFVYRTRTSGMVNSVAIFESLPKRDKRIKAVADWREPEGRHPLKNNAPVTDKELRKVVIQGVDANSLAGFSPIQFSDDLVPPEPSFSSDIKPGSLRMRGTNRIFLFAESERSSFQFTVQGGLVYGTRGPVKLRLFAQLNPLVDEPVATVDVPADKATHQVSLSSSYSGLHWLEIADGNDVTKIFWPAGQKAVLPASPAKHPTFYGAYDAVFYVPPGTKAVGGYSDTPVGRMETSGGEVKLDFATMDGPGYFLIPVAEESGSWWRLRQVRGARLLLTVPPYLARIPGELLVPQEVLSKKQPTQ